MAHGDTGARQPPGVDQRSEAHTALGTGHCSAWQTVIWVAARMAPMRKINSSRIIQLSISVTVSLPRILWTGGFLTNPGKYFLESILYRLVESGPPASLRHTSCAWKVLSRLKKGTELPQSALSPTAAATSQPATLLGGDAAPTVWKSDLFPTPDTLSKSNYGLNSALPIKHILFCGIKSE